MKVIFEHYRIPRKRTQRKRGRPANTDLIRYSRAAGWGKNWLDGPEIHLFGLPPLSRGGMTRCIIEDGNGRRAAGEALCSMADNFCYRVGRDIAYGRALKERQA